MPKETLITTVDGLTLGQIVRRPSDKFARKVTAPNAGTFIEKTAANWADIMQPLNKVVIQAGDSADYWADFPSDVPAASGYSVEVYRIVAGNPTDGPPTWILEVDWAGGVAVPPPVPNEPTSLYDTWEDFKNRWGERPIIAASNKDSTAQTPNMATIQQSFTYADNELHNLFRGSVYKVPFEFAELDGTAIATPEVVKDWHQVIAYDHLYHARGVEDRDKRGNKIRKLREEVYTDVGLYKVGLKQLQAKYLDNAVTFEVKPISGNYNPYGPAGWYRAADGQIIWY